MTTQDANVSLIDVAKQLHAAKADALTTKDIAQRMKVSKEWVRRFLAGEIPNPGVRTVESFIKAVSELTNA